MPTCTAIFLQSKPRSASSKTTQKSAMVSSINSQMWLNGSKTWSDTLRMSSRLLTWPLMELGLRAAPRRRWAPPVHFCLNAVGVSESLAKAEVRAVLWRRPLRGCYCLWLISWYSQWRFFISYFVRRDSPWRLLGLVGWFALRVREVPGSIPGGAQFFLVFFNDFFYVESLA